MGKGKPGEPTDAETVPLGPSTSAVDNSGTPKPLNLSLAGGNNQPSNGDAAAQYKAGYDAIVRGAVDEDRLDPAPAGEDLERADPAGGGVTLAGRR